MTYTRNLCFENRVLAPGLLTRALRTFAENYLAEPEPLFNQSRSLPDNVTEAMESFEPEDAGTVCDLQGLHIWGTFRDKDSRFIQLHIVGRDNQILVEISADDVVAMEGIGAILESALSLKKTTGTSRQGAQEGRAAAIEERVGNLTLRLASLEMAVHQVAPRLRCFLSYRFGGENELVALRVQRFLALLSVDVVSGETYEPRPISQKVAAKLASPLSFLVLIVLANGESPWTRDEIATAKARGMFVVPLVEEGARFEPGLFGDLELISFATDHVGDAFLKLLEAVVYIRTEMARNDGTKPPEKAP
jgi:hypothetical protein